MPTTMPENLMYFAQAVLMGSFIIRLSIEFIGFENNEITITETVTAMQKLISIKYKNI